MKTVLKTLFLAAVAALSMGAIAQPASARTTPANLGKAWDPAENGCFRDYYGGVYNGSPGCSGPRLYLNPVVVDSAGWYTLHVGSYPASLSSDVSCRAVGLSWDGLVWDLYPAKSPSSAGVWQLIDVTTWFPGWGAPMLACSLTPNSKLSTITY